VIGGRSVNVLTAHWSVFYRFLLKVVLTNFAGCAVSYSPEKLIVAYL